MQDKKGYIEKGNKLFKQIQDLVKQIDNTKDKAQIEFLQKQLDKAQKDFNRIFDIVFK